MKKKIIIIEDHEDIQALYFAAFKKKPDVEIIKQFSTAEEAMEKIPVLKPDLVIIDISLPGISGLDLIQALRSRYSAMKILVVTGHDKDRYYDIALQMGANDLITKGSIEELYATVKKLLEDSSFQ